MELRLCPFCDGEASVMHSYKSVCNKKTMVLTELSTTYWVKCDQCNVSQWYHATEKEAVEAWNKRAADLGRV